MLTAKTIARGALSLAAALLIALPGAAAQAASYRACEPVRDPYAGTRYEGVDLSRIRALHVSCATARRVARGAHRQALGSTPSEDGIVRVRWNGWSVTGDLRGASDRYVATKGTNRVRWRF